MINGLVSSLYTALAFAEVAVLLASCATLFAFIARQVFQKIQALFDAAAGLDLRETKTFIKAQKPLWASAFVGPQKVSGGHNERF
jgi:ABC-type sulfate transport system permease component